jgi:pseudouridine 5'-phosphatase
MTPLPPIKACLFDVDGLLIDSEDILSLNTNLILRQYHRPDLPWSLKARLQGRPAPESYKLLQEWAQLPLTKDEFFEKTKQLQEQNFPRTKPLPGVQSLIESLSKSTVEMAVATSSTQRPFQLKTSHLPQVFKYFQRENIVVADDPRIAQGRGKPAPDIYLLALQTVNDRRKREGAGEIYPEECLVFEDAVPGVEAGRRAGMRVAWVPHVGLRGEYLGREGEVLAGLTGEYEEDPETAGKMDWKARREEWVAEGRAHARVREEPGEVDDGWARLYDTLEGFPYADYGIAI